MLIRQLSRSVRFEASSTVGGTGLIYAAVVRLAGTGDSDPRLALLVNDLAKFDPCSVVDVVSVDRVENAYRSVHPRLWHALLAYSGDGDVASDAAAEAFSQLLRRGDGVRDVDAWVWRCAFRVAGGLLQDRQRIARPPLPQEPAWAADHSSVAEFMSQLGGLSTQQRAIVALRYIGGFRPGEIADLVDSTPGSVRVQLHRAHAHLRVALEDSNG